MRFKDRLDTSSKALHEQAGVDFSASTRQALNIQCASGSDQGGAVTRQQEKNRRARAMAQQKKAARESAAGHKDNQVPLV